MLCVGEEILCLLADCIADHKGLFRATYPSVLFRELAIDTQRNTARDILEQAGGHLSAPLTS
jgi:hypothetical protein